MSRWLWRSRIFSAAMNWHGAEHNAGHVSLEQLKVMSAIENCRTATLGGHVARCEDCAYTTIAYNSCRNRHCPKCQGAAAKDWLAAREADLLPVPYYHVVARLTLKLRCALRRQLSNCLLRTSQSLRCGP